MTYHNTRLVTDHNKRQVTDHNTRLVKDHNTGQAGRPPLPDLLDMVMI